MHPVGTKSTGDISNEKTEVLTSFPLFFAIHSTLIHSLFHVSTITKRIVAARGIIKRTHAHARRRQHQLLRQRDKKSFLYFSLLVLIDFKP